MAAAFGTPSGSTTSRSRPSSRASSGSPFTERRQRQHRRPRIASPTGILGAGGTNRLPSIERNTFRNPYTTNVDLRIARTFALPGKARIEVLAEAFNLFNRINYTAVNNTFYTIGGTAAAPTLTYNAATFNTPINANNGTFAPRPREIQFGIRVNF